jgi:uncharacterized protein YecE (DUF72 family)
VSGLADQAKILLGTSGWNYKDWVGPFYSEGEKSLLKAYAKVFKTAEIDSTFYAYPSKGTVMGWLKYTPEDFVFTAKLPKLITHEKMLDLSLKVEDDVNRFVELLEPLWLGGKLGCILVQLPPKLEFNQKTLEDFLKVLPRQVRWAVEFREASWLREETWSTLKKFNVAYTIVDEPLLPPEIHITADFAYFRWHGKGLRPWYNYRYTREELEIWVPRLKDAAQQTQVVYGYFNNHYHGYAVENCLQVLEMLGALTPEQAEAKNRVESYYVVKAPVEAKEEKLEAFVEPSELTFDVLLNAFIDEDRLKRARKIKDEEVSIKVQTDDVVEAKVKEYTIIIDAKAKTILHDCADWSRVLPTKKICKHIGKLLLTIDRVKAENILKELYYKRESWQFKPYIHQA